MNINDISDFTSQSLNKSIMYTQNITICLFVCLFNSLTPQSESLEADSSPNYIACDAPVLDLVYAPFQQRECHIKWTVHITNLSGMHHYYGFMPIFIRESHIRWTVHLTILPVMHQY
ncbi:hypothetical protein ACF0H5_012321 [Mactra antiquata]